MRKELYRRENGVIRYYPKGVPDEKPKASKRAQGTERRKVKKTKAGAFHVEQTRHGS